MHTQMSRKPQCALCSFYCWDNLFNETISSKKFPHQKTKTKTKVKIELVICQKVSFSSVFFLFLHIIKWRWIKMA